MPMKLPAHSPERRAAVALQRGALATLALCIPLLLALHSGSKDGVALQLNASGRGGKKLEGQPPAAALVQGQELQDGAEQALPEPDPAEELQLELEQLQAQVAAARAEAASSAGKLSAAQAEGLKLKQAVFRCAQVSEELRKARRQAANFKKAKQKLEFEAASDLQDDALADRAVFGTLMRRLDLSERRRPRQGGQGPWAALPPGPLRRGIVMAAGGRKSVTNAFVVLRVLRQLHNCSLPAVIMYWGSIPGDRVNNATRVFIQDELEGVAVVDASKLPYPAHHRWLFPPWTKNLTVGMGFSIKVFSVYAAPFQEVLYLDSDSLPVLDPGLLFDLPEYTRAGNLFWPDLWCREVGLYHALGLASPWAKGKQLQTESGQLLINRHRHADVLEWLLWLNTHRAFSSKHAWGDKDQFRVAFALAGKHQEFSQVDQIPSRALESVGVEEGKELVHSIALLQHLPNGTIMFLHQAGTKKYNPDSNSTREFNRVILQASCEWYKRHGQYGDTLRRVSWEHAHVIQPGGCTYDLVDPLQTLQACGLQYNWRTAGESGRPAVLQLSPGQQLYISRVHAEAGKAFEHLRAQMLERIALF